MLHARAMDGPTETAAVNFETVDFSRIRDDWYHGVEYVVTLLVRAVKRQIEPERRDGPSLLFRGFPSQWLPLFEWLHLRWDEPAPVSQYIPFLTTQGSEGILAEIERAKQEGQLRLLVEMVSGCDAVMAEALPRLDNRIALLPAIQPRSACRGNGHGSAPRIRLTNWHAYGRAEVIAYERDLLAGFEQRHEDVIFLPCGRTRPYDRSPTHRRLCRSLGQAGVDIARHDVIVITSLGPVPEALFDHPTVMAYDTGVRDIHRMLTLFRRIFRGVRYRTAWDCMAFEPYRDIIRSLRTDGHVSEIKHPEGIKPKRLATYSAGRARS